MALNSCEMLSNGIKTAFYFKKLQKIAKQLGLRSQIPVLMHLSYISLLNTSSKFDICTF